MLRVLGLAGLAAGGDPGGGGECCCLGVSVVAGPCSRGRERGRAQTTEGLGAAPVLTTSESEPCGGGSFRTSASGRELACPDVGLCTRVVRGTLAV